MSVADVVDEQDILQRIADDYVQKLKGAGLLERAREQRPDEYDAEPVSLTLSADDESRTIHPTGS